jgi:ribosomal protein L40E
MSCFNMLSLDIKNKSRQLVLRMINSILTSTCSSSLVTQPLTVDESLITLILVGGIAIGLAFGIGLGAFLFGLKFWYRTSHRIPTEAMSTRIVSGASPHLINHQNSKSMLEPRLMSEKKAPIKSCVKCGKALPLDAHYCSECREEQDYSS